MKPSQIFSLLLDVLLHNGQRCSATRGGKVAWGPEHALVTPLGNVRMLRRLLEYKQTWRGGVVITVHPRYTSQECPECHHKVSFVETAGRVTLGCHQDIISSVGLRQQWALFQAVPEVGYNNAKLLAPARPAIGVSRRQDDQKR